ncbi:MAG: methyltransferase domain-containing protein [Candidatus Magnetominusculus sp. LBB02]|nr:methyltransferase domain-containing protein [Candidatus Magnetominusculus sp. LBB02]
MEFDKSKWADTAFSRDYLDKAEIYIVERRMMFSLVNSFCRHFINGPLSLLDLGSGDGALTHELLKAGTAASAVLVDGSKDMLDKAEARLKDFDLPKQFINCSFEEMVRQQDFPSGFDMVVSALAIHHLITDDKAALYNKIYRLLNRGGYFVNVDVVIAPSDSIENWYMEIWKDWMRTKQAALGVDEPVEAIIHRYKDLAENKPDTLDCQLAMLKNAGFKEIDCYFKYGIFTIFGGKK